MANKKIEKALYGPSTLEVAIGALLGLLLGVVAAAVFLVFKPVQTVKEKPKEMTKGVVYYWAGRTDPNKARAWQDKIATFTKGGAVVLSEDELNAWATSVSGGAAVQPAAKPGEKPKGDAKSPTDSGSSDFVSASGLNFRIEDGHLHLAAKVLLNYYGLTKEVMLQASGGFAPSNEGYVFKPDQVLLGSCPVSSLPWVSGALTRSLVGKVKVSDDFRAAWMKITEATVEGDLVKVTTTP